MSEEGILAWLRKGPRLKVWHTLIMAEIIGEKIGDALRGVRPLPELRPPEVIEVPPERVLELPLPELKEISEKLDRLRPPEVVTKTLDRRMEFEGAKEILSVTGRGRLREFILRAASKEFRVEIMVDGVPKIDRSFDDLGRITAYLDTIDAFEVDGEYVVRIGEMSWLKTFRLMIYANGRIEFPDVFAVYDTYKT